jgi:hypothetical protein
LPAVDEHEEERSPPSGRRAQTPRRRTALEAVTLLVGLLLLAACGAGPDDESQSGGLYGRCLRAGEIFEGKEGHCCPGLTGLDVLKEGEPGSPGLPPGCMYDAPPSIRVCGICGNGTCGAGEDRCNCPADCTR